MGQKTQKKIFNSLTWCKIIKSQPQTPIKLFISYSDTLKAVWGYFEHDLKDPLAWAAHKYFQPSPVSRNSSFPPGFVSPHEQLGSAEKGEAQECSDTKCLVTSAWGGGKQQTPPAANVLTARAGGSRRMNLPWNVQGLGLEAPGGWICCGTGTEQPCWDGGDHGESLICSAFQNESCKLLRLLPINTAREHTVGLKNNTDRGAGLQQVAMVELQLESHKKNYCLWSDGTPKLSPPINNWAKCLTCLRKELSPFISGFVQCRSLDFVTLDQWWCDFGMASSVWYKRQMFVLVYQDTRPTISCSRFHNNFCLQSSCTSLFNRVKVLQGHVGFILKGTISSEFLLRLEIQNCWEKKILFKLKPSKNFQSFSPFISRSLPSI